MVIPTEQLLNIPGIRVLSVKYDEDKIECQIESTQGYSLCHRCGQKATEFHGYDQALELRHLPLFIISLVSTAQASCVLLIFLANTAEPK
jgi:hypothetical protein